MAQIEVDVEIIGRTSSALHVEVERMGRHGPDEPRELWIPKSLIAAQEDKVRYVSTLTVPPVVRRKGGTGLMELPLVRPCDMCGTGTGHLHLEPYDHGPNHRSKGQYYRHAVKATPRCLPCSKQSKERRRTA